MWCPVALCLALIRKPLNIQILCGALLHCVWHSYASLWIFRFYVVHCCTVSGTHTQAFEYSDFMWCPVALCLALGGFCVTKIIIVSIWSIQIACHMPHNRCEQSHFLGHRVVYLLESGCRCSGPRMTQQRRKLDSSDDTLRASFWDSWVSRSRLTSRSSTHVDMSTTMSADMSPLSIMLMLS